VLDGIDTAAARHLIGRAADVAPEPVSALQHRLVDSGFLWPTGDAATDDERRTVAAPRLDAELTALSARVGAGAAQVLDSRRQGCVAVHGLGRVGPHIASVLAAAGVGRVHVVGDTPVRLHQAVPGGLLPRDEGRPLHEAAAAAAHRGAPETVCVPPAYGDAPDLVILAIDEPVEDERRDALHARLWPHLLVRSSGDHAAVGPLVIPGLTSCLRCVDLHRLDRDPAWRALAVQLSVANRTGGVTEVALATVVAGVAALQALEFLDGGRPATVEGTVEMTLPDWRLRRRSWPAHPDCDCMTLSTSGCA
jgi:bacteriocin biosynthesis cyclodehydratase domain-containing protein